ncbi:MAG TPA: hypothetical protein VIS99_00640, partial [Terrimicrobiaceae bacterium]
MSNWFRQRSLPAALSMKPNLSFFKAVGIVATAIVATAATSQLEAAFYDKPVTGAPPPEASESSLSGWWNGKYATGNWFGVRDTLEDRGLKLGGRWIGVYY